jgi:hypothetical protein
MDPIQPILPSSANIPPVTGAPMLPRVSRDERERRQSEQERKRREREQSGAEDDDDGDGGPPRHRIDISA